MTEREYRTVDKSSWGSGPWENEPDKIQFTDEATGLPCLVVRGPSGALCGYVGVAEDHPWFGKEYDQTLAGKDDWANTPERRTAVHGGLTYSAPCQDGDEATGICHVPEPGHPDHVWWFGFDCAHLGDHSPKFAWGMAEIGGGRFTDWHGDTYRDLAYVRAQCSDLAGQLVAVRP